jgi:hypothetical protein
MRRHLIRWTTAVLALAPALAAQAGFGPGGKDVTSSGVSAVRVVVLLDQSIGPDVVCSLGAVKVLDQSSVPGMFLLESTEPIPDSQAGIFAVQIGKIPGVVSSELLQKAGLPEVESCGEPFGVSAQQCTIAFADGTPSEGEYKHQDPLKDLGYKGIQSWWFNAHKPTLVAVIDTGVDATHPAIASNVVPFGWDFVDGVPGAIDKTNGVDDDGDGYVDEAYGHGTHLSSIIVLLNPDARILPIRVLDADGNGESFSVAEAIIYAVDHGAEVINLSLSMKSSSDAVAVALEYANYSGVPVFASAGNTGKKKVLFPGNYDPRKFNYDLPFAPVGWKPSSETVTTVASTAKCDVKAEFSSYGKSVDLVAPGVDIYGAMPGGGYAWWSGTSMSTAVASAVASLVLSVAGDDEIPVPPQHLLMVTAENVDWKNWAFKGLLGTGAVDAWHASIEAAKY